MRYSNYFRSFKVIFTLAFFFFTCSSILLFSEEDSEIKIGEKIFQGNCTACHNLTGYTKLSGRSVGPDLSGVTDRREIDWLKKWIKNNKELRESGDKDAIEIFEQYNGSIMQAFDWLSDEEMNGLISFLANPPVNEALIVVADDVSVVQEDEGMSLSTQMMLIALALATLLYLLSSVKNSLKSSMGQETETISQTVSNQTKSFFSQNRNVIFIVVIALIFLAKIGYDALLDVGVTKGYQPEQPIAFSHKVHAGDNDIDCNYCHSSARHSMSAGIPSANVCMNCHANIVEGTVTGTTEIQKIYDAVGYDPETRTYKQNYTQQPIKWIRIHNLPDLAYFNHSQHVSVAGVDCETCHGPVDEMDILAQYADLTMDWCIECHRETDVNMKDNEYYASMHEKLKDSLGVENFTVDQIGGLECGKCHY
tara:strand:- start:345 stop:1610 length:1266 start_codon:yes stop_codon:yes gene_type:complete